MSLRPGTRLGSYEIITVIGAGGMGEVYRARDTKLNRDVALKILPDAFAADPDRLARFTREAQTLASLNHPNIAQIHGLEDSLPVDVDAKTTIRALVMELVEGQDLSQQIAIGPIPHDDAIAIGKQIADAMEAAHEQGIVHRDLKPGNVKVRPDGTVKVLDFGLAKALEGTGSTVTAQALSLSPTMASPAMTGVGIIIGTAAYMSPEQAKGKPVDKRADIWAFGVVLYEMLTGRTMFAGETVSEVLAAVIMREPDLAALPASVPARTTQLIARCLVKDPKLRLRDIGEARLSLTDSTPGTTPVPDTLERPGPSHARGASRWLVALATGLALALGVTGFALWRVTARTQSPIVRYEVRPPDKAALSIVGRPGIGISPDGSHIALVASSDGVARLYLRSRDDTALRPLPQTEDASNPVFSTDGSEIAFFANGLLKTISLTGAVSTVADAGTDGDPRGITWLADGTLVYSPDAVSPLVQVHSTEGTPRPLTTLDEKNGERTHRWPAALPGGKAVLFTVGMISSPDNYDGATIEAVIVATGERRVVLRGASSARYVATGHLLFLRGSSVFAVGFDVDRLAVQGAPVQVLSGVNGDVTTGAAHLWISDNGTMAYIPGGALAATNRLMWVDRTGTTQPVELPQGLYFDPRMSPDGTRVAVSWQPINAGSADIWVGDLVRKTFTRLSFSGNAASPVWSADGRTIYYVHTDPTGRKSTIMRKPADGSRESESLVTLENRAYLDAVTQDEQFALIDYAPSTGGNRRGEVMRMALRANATPEPLVATQSDEYAGSWSPDGRWLAYVSDETGREEVYVRDLSGTGGRWQVSTTGGNEPHWSADGRELFYRTDTRLMSVVLEGRTTFQPKTPVVLFDGVYNLRSDTGISYAVDSKNDRFLMIRLAGDNVASAITVVTNWFNELQRLTSRP